MICCRKSKNLQDTQKALKEQKKKCALEIKNAMKRKQRLQGKASQLSDSDLVEILRMRKAKKESLQTAANTPPPDGPHALATLKRFHPSVFLSPEQCCACVHV